MLKNLQKIIVNLEVLKNFLLKYFVVLLANNLNNLETSILELNSNLYLILLRITLYFYFTFSNSFKQNFFIN